MAKDLMRYDLMAQDALRGVVRQALLKAGGPEGLPGQHHFYITFRTRAPGVDIDPSLLEKYPEEMTIVLEHQFWDLDVTETGFEVTLKFSGVPKYLKMPYSAISRFHDPSVGFHLQFEQEPDAEAAQTGPDDDEPKAAAGGKAPAGKVKPKSGDGAQVVSLDSFRKK
ncbi:ClpXP protease specificity-enhancing factor SspB [Maricaulis sp.]|uniref:SspB family protein n=1 Tax=Maricaulis sp. TaxID=1486257 RepID=UPI0026283BC8|nr:ClpXP protease specificity-enhancing factor SspB [Maricaulis sp.]